MAGDAPISLLMFFTLVAGLAVGAGYFLYFLRSRHNREIAALALEGDGRSQGVAPSGAGAELVGLLAIALIAMALLTAGYSTRRDTKPTPQGSAATNNSLNTSRADPNTAKPYQPQIQIRTPGPHQQARLPEAAPTTVVGQSNNRSRNKKFRCFSGTADPRTVRRVSRQLLCLLLALCGKALLPETDYYAVKL